MNKPMDRVDFANSETHIPIPNLLHVQKESYEHFLQMNRLPEEKEDSGLQSVFSSIFPFANFRETCSIDFMHYTIGDWQCRCGKVEGLHLMRLPCGKCGFNIPVKDHQEYIQICTKCGFQNEYKPTLCTSCGYPVELRLPFTPEECLERGLTYSAPLRVTFRMFFYEKTAAGKNKVKDVKQEEVYFGDLPLMTDTGTFIINGTERVVVSQLHRSPGVFFTQEGPYHFMGKVIPYRGSWVEFEFDRKGILYIRIDRRRKLIGSIYLRCLGLSTSEEILRKFYSPVKMKPLKESVELTFTSEVLEQEEIREKERTLTGQTVTTKIFAGIKWNKALQDTLKKKGAATRAVKFNQVALGRFIHDVVNMKTGEVLFEANELVPLTFAQAFQEHGIKEAEIFFPQSDLAADVLSNTLENDMTVNKEEALLEFYKRMRPGEPPTKDNAQALFNSTFFDERRYDFSEVGRFKFNIKMDVSTPMADKVLSAEDYYLVVRYLLRLRKGIGYVDDIDNLGNRRVKPVGELLENQFRIGVVRMERAIKEKMSVLQDLANAMPRDVVNAKPAMAAVKEFFGSSQLSQFMDQTNPLAEITHKRRLSALGPGGLSRERAGFEVRDVHTTHYGRICPIETPEGPNIGLISSLATYAQINRYGFLESPYKKVAAGKVLDHVKITRPGDSDYKIEEIILLKDLDKTNRKLLKQKKIPVTAVPYAFSLSAWEEERYIIAQASAKIDKKGTILTEQVIARYGGEFITIDKNRVDYIDVSPKQLVSVATALIPFLEHDDANRALMGSNMQRQAVPLIISESPIVGTGFEGMVARDSGAVVICKRSGVVESVDAERVIVRVESKDIATGEQKEFGADIYPLVKYKRSNQNTCINQVPVVLNGDRVEVGQILADGPSTQNGELALGRNILCAFMPWRGYNYEDAILINENIVKEDAYTSIHIEEFECEARDTKLGPEEITRDIPNVSDSALKDLDESGIVCIGAKIKTGNILVGRVTPKGETHLSPEEKLLRAIFGEKAGDVKDASLRVPPGIEGSVVNARIFYRKGVDKDLRALHIEEEFEQKLERNFKDQQRIFNEERDKNIFQLLQGVKAKSGVKDSKSGKVVVKKGGTFSLDTVQNLSTKVLKNLPITDTEIKDEIATIISRTAAKLEVLKRDIQSKVENLHSGEELAPGIIKKVKVFVAMKRKLNVGDKMAGRHGNKGVISRIVPEEDMPYLPDGTPVDIVLNPLGVPSRMNVGQILETHLGWAGKALGLKFQSPVFDGAHENQIKAYLKDAGLPETGKTVVYDGMTGEPFDQKITVGQIYMMKLVHMVDDKIHARSIGPYSLITQQPLGGKAQFGGQRFGEMEVWALESYGAAYTLQELLTYKSDDVEGRTKLYEAVVKGKIPEDPGVPESFNVLIRELRSLCLDVELLNV